ncbi:arsenate-mycothiol transferase ArsC [Pengzhenrongella sicca]|uniref:Heat-shock protein HtpX n=1 Tax=Pengzhenrongella sicca TaxID=2819238 RepID=A0A8A4ZAT1_9MICO|nr:heat-shock protein HtpX [Pengzhenrongella sicca]QTE28521.1 heat-shock protein HtpX [Pengzhenrongella sicca]
MAPPTVLFVCVHNAGRSQLAAGLAEFHARGRVAVLSAGTDPEAEVSDVVLASLAELGIDRRDQQPTRLTEDLLRAADVVVALKPGLELTVYPGAHHETWALPDPAGWDVDGIRPLRTYLDREVRRVIAAVGTEH